MIYCPLQTVVTGIVSYLESLVLEGEGEKKKKKILVNFVHLISLSSLSCVATFLIKLIWGVCSCSYIGGIAKAIAYLTALLF